LNLKNKFYTMSATQSSSLGPRKRKETSRIIENADPLLARNKKARTAQAPKNPVQKPTPTAKAKAATLQANKRPQSVVQTSARSVSTWQSSVEIEDVIDEAVDVRGEQPLNPDHIIEAADGSDDVDNDPAPGLIKVDDEDEEEPKESSEETEESAESELRESAINFKHCYDSVALE
jgi:hypothetical protein